MPGRSDSEREYFCWCVGVWVPFAWGPVSGLLHLERKNDASRVLLRATAGVSGDRRRTATRYSLDIRAFTQHRLLLESHVERVLTAASWPPSAYSLSKPTEISDWPPPYSIDVPPRFGAEQQAHRDRDRRRRGRRMPVRRCWRRMPRRERGSVGLLSFRGAPVGLMRTASVEEADVSGLDYVGGLAERPSC